MRKDKRGLTKTDAHHLLISLTQTFAPNFSQLAPIKWTPQDIRQFFHSLGCPYEVRPDAIQAVGAPNSVGYLVRALFWLYLLARQFYQSGDDAIAEVEDSENMQSIANQNTVDTVQIALDEVLTQIS